MTAVIDNPKEAFAKAIAVGKVVATDGIVKDIGSITVSLCVSRHTKGDFGEVPPDDVVLNMQGLIEGGQIVSIYNDVPALDGGKAVCWVITEAGWQGKQSCVTRVMRPADF